MQIVPREDDLMWKSKFFLLFLGGGGVGVEKELGLLGCLFGLFTLGNIRVGSLGVGGVNHGKGRIDGAGGGSSGEGKGRGL